MSAVKGGHEDRGWVGLYKAWSTMPVAMEKLPPKASWWLLGILAMTVGGSDPVQYRGPDSHVSH